MVNTTEHSATTFSNRWSKLLFTGGALTFASGMAQAGITYSGVLNTTVTSPNTLSVDFDGGGNDALFTLTATDIRLESSSSGWAYAADPGPVTRFDVASTIDSSLTYQSASDQLIYFSDPDWKGNFGKSHLGTPGYVGFRLDTGSGYKYGWAQVEANGSGTTGSTSTSLILKDFAYENLLDTPIAAGDTGISAVPEPSSMALFALGAAGLAALRRRKQSKTDGDC